MLAPFRDQLADHATRTTDSADEPTGDGEQEPDLPTATHTGRDVENIF